MVKRLYIPLPNDEAREQMVRHHFRKHSNSLTDSDMRTILDKTRGYSGELDWVWWVDG